ncbi:RING finger and CHY zinc finger domain-containing protein 1 [Mytilus galloprovincialis]|uniref:RING finger and CHY zinc finger domain-containing protein 1 n=1 Tax=Mytilus galloprovincialis TaxID=29158 RepID=A0A8B6DGH2_MYTGA|nr:RING finger and CHY zinc finger domain-containing protein 1 [Mytilus galloprovincialis]
MSTEEPQKPNDDLGCQHYKRKCKLLAPCCNRDYFCRICHDEKENHVLDRHSVKKVVCAKCEEVQEKHEKCTKCDIVFGKYFCSFCSLFDDEDKKQFHCQGCGLCRVGGRENFFHCETCDMCLALDLKDQHKCIVKSSRSNCAVCLEDLHTSRIEAHIPQCGHLIHSNYACPICGESMLNMKEIWENLDEEVANCQMPDEYKDYHIQILCRDCHKESNVVFHVLGSKCSECGSYNTCRTAGPESNNPNVVSGASNTSETNQASNNAPEPVAANQPWLEMLESEDTTEQSGQTSDERKESNTTNDQRST